MFFRVLAVGRQRLALLSFVWGILCLAMMTHAIPSGTKPKADRLDTAGLRKQYLEGEFAKVTDSLESWRALGSVGTRHDSVFAYRHLGIIYATSEASRVRAESFMNLLLRLEPDIEILDPYVSAKVDVIWDQVRQRNAKVTGRPLSDRQANLEPSANRGNADGKTWPQKTPSEVGTKNGFPWLWTMGGALVVGGIVAFYFWDQAQNPGLSSGDAEPMLDTADITIKVPRKP